MFSPKSYWSTVELNEALNISHVWISVILLLKLSLKPHTLHYIWIWKLILCLFLYFFIGLQWFLSVSVFMNVSSYMTGSTNYIRAEFGKSCVEILHFIRHSLLLLVYSRNSGAWSLVSHFSLSSEYFSGYAYFMKLSFCILLADTLNSCLQLLPKKNMLTFCDNMPKLWNLDPTWHL